MQLTNMKLKGISVGLAALVATSLAGGQVDFGAYYLFPA
jgi:hypothetical protein